MSATNLYELLKPLSDAGRGIAAQQQGSADGSAISLCAKPVMHDVCGVRYFAEQAAGHTAIWQGMPQAGISLTDVTR